MLVTITETRGAGGRYGMLPGSPRLQGRCMKASPITGQERWSRLGAEGCLGADENGDVHVLWWSVVGGAEGNRTVEFWMQGWDSYDIYQAVDPYTGRNRIRS